MADDYSIKRLGPDDMNAFRAWVEMFAAAFEDEEEYLGKPPSDDYVANLLSEESFIALAATANEAVVGGLAAYEFKKFEQARSEFYIYDLAVAAPFRLKGIATALIETLKPIARARGGHVMFIQADKGDEAPVTLYSKLGNREDIHHFDIAVD